MPTIRDPLATYRIWAPDGAAWTQWAKPVLFASPPPSLDGELAERDARWMPERASDAMAIVDLPGRTSVEVGIALARMGYRPVPLFNGVRGPSARASIVDVEAIVRALYRGADELHALMLPIGAPPAFLLDADRMSGGGKQPGRYDNRWCVFPQDMPSAAYLVARGIRRAFVCTGRIQDDLLHVLCRYREQGIEIWQCGEGIAPRRVDAQAPSKFKALWYRAGVIAGLSRNAAGGFGVYVPEMTQGQGGYYRIG